MLYICYKNIYRKSKRSEQTDKQQTNRKKEKFNEKQRETIQVEQGKALLRMYKKYIKAYIYIYIYIYVCVCVYVYIYIYIYIYII